MGSGTVMLLESCRDAPLATVVVPDVLPNPAELDTDRIPVLTSVLPV